MLVRIVAPHFVAGLILDEVGVVRQAAPILRWTLGKPWSEVRAYCQRKGWGRQRVELKDQGRGC